MVWLIRLSQWIIGAKKQNHLFEYIHKNKMVKHLLEFLQNALSKNKSDAAFAAIILSEKAALHTSHNIIVHWDYKCYNNFPSSESANHWLLKSNAAH